MNKMRMEHNPSALSNEIEILSEMGLDNSEIQFLIHLKEKQEISEKWE